MLIAKNKKDNGELVLNARFETKEEDDFYAKTMKALKEFHDNNTDFQGNFQTSCEEELVLELFITFFMAVMSHEDRAYIESTPYKKIRIRVLPSTPYSQRLIDFAMDTQLKGDVMQKYINAYATFDASKED
jgi:hypothetical protein